MIIILVYIYIYQFVWKSMFKIIIAEEWSD